MEFKKYGSLTNHYQKKFIDKVIMNGMDDGVWVATEKVHGANFAFWFDGVEHSQSKRSSFCNENFFNCGAVFKYRAGVFEIYEELLKDGTINDGDTITIYGELFGGKFDGKKGHQAKTIQKNGADYSPENEFMAFDITVRTPEGGSYNFPFAQVKLLTSTHGIPLVPVLGTGSLTELLAVDNVFDSKVPDMLGLPHKTDNVAEGFVIRPLGADKFIGKGDGASRVIIKSKNALYSEKGKGMETENIIPLTELEKELLQDLTKYFTGARVDATISKEGEVTSFKDFPKISGLTFRDALEDFDIDFSASLKETIGDSWGVFSKTAKHLSDAVVRQRFLEIIG